MARVLIVDDSPPIRNFMRECLAHLGFTETTEAENGAIALSTCKQQLPDIITLDWNMPEMDGLSFLKALRKLPGGDMPKVVFCSTEANAKKIELVLNSGANAYITKPFDVWVVREKLEQLGLL